ncbi:drug/metabolite transporter (DMT)-like permease [Dongia mobilis]|uniref:Drug/metabolite transporter (DMT)-like permease n=1 Tax=Dongia mobilis TaxID=578943 RepID=A0A4R6WXL3_9PROT|nr:DMT family transporter [Dongia mobilis]TDQ82345.1 drug/metabolite transporter (DMT)-like permease [Dongia mobilis]
MTDRPDMDVTGGEAGKPLSPDPAPAPLPPLPSARERQLAADRPLYGILCLIGAGMIFSVFNAIVKHLGQELPVLEVAWGRYVFHLVFALGYAAIAARMTGLGSPLTWSQRWGNSLRSRRPGLQFLRSLLMLATTLLFFLALTYIDLATATAIAFVEPMVITILSFLILKETVGLRRWSAVIIGFVGVLIVVRPGFGMAHAAVLLPVLSASCGAGYNVLTRIAARHDGNATSLFYSALVGCVVLSACMPFVWQAPSWDQWLLLGAIGVTGGAAHTLVIRAFSFASASIVAPFIYVQLLWAMAIGYVWFDSWPILTTWIGAGIIIATGIYTAHRERVRARQKALSQKG